MMRVVVVPSPTVYRGVRHLSTARTALSVIQTRGVSSEKNSPASYQCVVIGGGTGGCAMASKMSRKLGRGKVAVIEPAQTHYHQGLWTLVGGGYKSFAQSGIDMDKAIPRGADWIRDSVLSVEPEQNLVITASGQKLTYDLLIVAAGIKLDYDRIEGAEDALDEDRRVVSTYSPQYVKKTYKALQNFNKGGTAIFTMPPMPIKCAGAPQKIMYLFEDHLRKTGRRDGSKILYNTNLSVIFGVKKYADVLLDMATKRSIDVNFEHNLVGVDHNKSEATFTKSGNPEVTITMNYDLLHIAPPMKAHDFLQDSPISNEAGFVEVDKDYLQSTKYENVFALGDCSNLPTSKTAAAIASESGVLEKSIEAFLKGGKPSKYKYNGYTSCPLVTREGRTILAEFDYNGEPLETFPINQGKERRTMWFMKKDIVPFLYWNMLIRGRWNGPGIFRKILHLGMGK